MDINGGLIMNQYYILEIQQYQTGEYGHIVHFAYDEDASKARLKAESKYHEVLAAAAVSDLLSHSATLIAANGQSLMYQCYKHAPQGVAPDENVES